MRWKLPAALAALALAAPAALAGLGIGDKAPLPTAKETVNLPSFAPKDVEGKVVLYEIFRTW